MHTNKKMQKEEYDKVMKKLKTEEHHIIQKIGNECFENLNGKNKDNSGGIKEIDITGPKRMSTYELKFFGKSVQRPIFVQFTIEDDSSTDDYAEIINHCLKHVQREDVKFCSIYKDSAQVAQRNKSDKKWSLNGIANFEGKRNVMIHMLKYAKEIMLNPKTDTTSRCDVKYIDKEGTEKYRSAWSMSNGMEIYTTLSRPILNVENKFMRHTSNEQNSTKILEVITCNLGSSYSLVKKKYLQEDKIIEKDIERLDRVFNFEAPGMNRSHNRCLFIIKYNHIFYNFCPSMLIK
jgi:hypothetical protein